ncbi:MAG: acetolactate synthase small subunit [Clostridiales bacterium]|jgi:acetolactate synthase-1/3 small subunit|nr:acetolactate synthase small subunit [Clostridiales bacterium]
MDSNRHIIIMRVDNKPGVLSRIAGLFTRRGYNIDSLVTGPTEDPDVYHMTITVIGEREIIDLLIRQLGRVMEVVEVFCADGDDYVTSELMLLRVCCPLSRRPEMLKLTEIIKVDVASVGSDSMVLRVIGDDLRHRTVIEAFREFGIERVIRSGPVSIEI